MAERAVFYAPDALEVEGRTAHLVRYSTHYHAPEELAKMGFTVEHAWSKLERDDFATLRSESKCNLPFGDVLCRLSVLSSTCCAFYFTSRTCNTIVLFNPTGNHVNNMNTFWVPVCANQRQR